MKSKVIVSLAVAALICALASSAAFGADEWRTYRQNLDRTGLVVNGGNGVLGGYRPSAIWIYPTAEVDTANIIDNADTSFTSSGFTVETPPLAAGFWGEDYTVAPTDTTGQFSATWTYDFANMKASSAAYYVYAWWPSPGPGEPLPHTEDARYTILINGVVVATAVADQSSGGSWVMLGYRPFAVNQGDKLEVKLTSKSEMKDDNGNWIASRVFADAVKIEQDAGGMVTSSPAVAQDNPVVVSCATTWDSLGVIYGIGRERNSGMATGDDRGKLKWRFPAVDRDWISGGISSSPATISTASGELAIVSGLDGQIYAIQANSSGPLGSLFWQGPGYVVDDASMTLTGSWPAGTGSGFRGAGYSEAQAVAEGSPSPATCTWMVSVPSSSVDRYYDIYAWIPPQSGHFWVSDAHYTEVDSNGLPVAGTTVTIPQYGSFWTLVRSKYPVPTAAGITTFGFQLTNESLGSAAVPAPWVAADALKIVPHGVGSFDFSSPAVENEPSTGDTYVYIGSTGFALGNDIGKVVKVEVAGGVHEPTWIYPAGTAMIGPVYASPTIHNDKVYVGSSDGHVYALDKATGALKWMYPAIGAKPLPEISSTGAITTINAETRIYVATGYASGVQDATMQGRVICLREIKDVNNNDLPEVVWTFPTDTASGVGPFKYSSPLIMERQSGDGIPCLFIGCTDGIVYGMAAAGDATTKTTTALTGVDFVGSVTSSLAGTYAGYPDKAGAVRAQDVPMAFAGSGKRIYGAELQTPLLDWWWDLLGDAMSSPAVSAGRIYIGDLSGYTWAFSSIANSTGTGVEEWNPDLGPGPPTGGSEKTSGAGVGKDALPNVDVLTKSQWQALKARMEQAEKHPDLADQADWFDRDKIHDYCRDQDGTAAHGSRPPTYTQEWGEDLYIIVWNLIDPNRKDSDPANWKKPEARQAGGFTEHYPGKVEITIKSTTGAATHTDTISGSAIDFFTDEQDDLNATSDPKNGYACFYAAYTYTLDASSQSKPQTPGAQFTVSAKEIPIAPNTSSTDIFVTSAGVNNTLFGINNPLGLLYKGPYGMVDTPLDVQIGVGSDGKTSRTLPDAQINGNPGDPPIVWGGFTPHNKLSDSRTVIVCDRSLLGAAGRKINRFKIQRSDLEWTSPPAAFPINFISAWETPPTSRLLGLPNVSDDYPDIAMNQIRCRMQANGFDPTQGSVQLRPTPDPNAGTTAAPWPVGPNNVNLAVFVPRFQPPNIPDAPGSAAGTLLKETGYTTTVFAYVDSNNNGMFDRPVALGIAGVQQQRGAGAGGEAYRAFDVQVHVPADYRAQIEEQRINVGAVPQGFGYTQGGGTLPRVFQPTLNFDPATRTLSPDGFFNWFKPFTARNIGNVNLLRVSLYRPEEGASGAFWWDLVSDTVTPPERDVVGNYWKWRPYTGYVIPYDDVVSSIDPWGNFMSSVPPVMGLTQRTMRTFHKPRVGESPPQLMIPDFPSWATVPGVPPQGPQPPTVSVAAPLSTPVGTYYGRLQLGETDSNGRQWPISNPVGLVVSVMEGKLTNGNLEAAFDAAPHLIHLDAAPTPSTDPATADGMPAAYRSPVTGNIELFWASSRYGPATRKQSVAQTAADPWYIYQSKLEAQTVNNYKEWRLSTSRPTQWWSPTDLGGILPPPGSLSTFFPGPVSGDTTRGAPGQILPSTVKFGSPSVAMNKINGNAWLFFTGQAWKDTGDPNLPTDRRRAVESRAYYVKLTDNPVNPVDIHSTSPYPASLPSIPQVRGEWTTPKFGIRGQVMVRDKGANPDLWCFWYGGTAGKWRIYYNANRLPDNPAEWSNEAVLPVPKGLSSVSEPSPVARWYDWPMDGRLSTSESFDVVYSAVSTFHGNSDIYLSRYLSANAPDPSRRGGSWPVSLVPLAQRARVLPQAEIVVNGGDFFGEKLERDPSRGVWFSRDVDWRSGVVSDVDATPTKPVTFAVYARLDPTAPAAVLQLNVGSYTKDPTTGAIVYTYDDVDPVTGSLMYKDQHDFFRAVVINPVEGTVRFERPPDKKALIVTQYIPQAYRLTTESVTDASPFALMDDDPNPRYSVGAPSGNPFYTPGGWDKNVQPPTDRLWTFWRRPSMDKPGTGVYYKTYRYAVQLGAQVGLEVDTVQGQKVYSPRVSKVEYLDDLTGTEKPIEMPVEVDWTKNRLYFTHIDSIYVNGLTKQPQLKKALVSYTDAMGGPHNREPYYIEFAEEDFGQSGRTFGNLTSVMVNEGQVSAFKDPLENKVWVFWTSTRSGNADIYYETVSPRFYGREMK